jgi:hypothetical protein
MRGRFACEPVGAVRSGEATPHHPGYCCIIIKTKGLQIGHFVFA